MRERLPEFPYHPDPLATGFVEMSNAGCLACERVRGFIYTGPVFAVEDIQESLCPWCIADGSAATRFEATFTDDTRVPDDVPGEVVMHVTTRTPGFRGWQQEHWLYHCGDGAAFLGVAGWPELEAHPAALDALRDENGDSGFSPQQVEDYLRSLDKDGSPAAYLFKCRRCGTDLAYSDRD
jgi:uncharacterized protein CbrC (UPF0167 family)